VLLNLDVEQKMETMSQYEVHDCRYQGLGIRVEHSRYGLNESFTWKLVVTRESTEEDLENNHYLENVGEDMWSVVVEINNCPFCGKELQAEKSEEIDFGLYDSTGISIRIL